MLLKESSKPRKRKAELEMAKRAKEEERQHIADLKGAEMAFQAKRYRLDDALNAIDQNEKMVAYLRERGVMDEDGNVKV